MGSRPSVPQTRESPGYSTSAGIEVLNRLDEDIKHIEYTISNNKRLHTFIEASKVQRTDDDKVVASVDTRREFSEALVTDNVERTQIVVRAYCGKLENSLDVTTRKLHHLLKVVTEKCAGQSPVVKDNARTKILLLDEMLLESKTRLASMKQNNAIPEIVREIEATIYDYEMARSDLLQDQPGPSHSVPVDIVKPTNDSDPELNEQWRSMTFTLKQANQALNEENTLLRSELQSKEAEILLLNEKLSEGPGNSDADRKLEEANEFVQKIEEQILEERLTHEVEINELKAIIEQLESRASERQKETLKRTVDKSSSPIQTDQLQRSDMFSDLNSTEFERWREKIDTSKKWATNKGRSKQNYVNKMRTGNVQTAGKENYSSKQTGEAFLTKSTTSSNTGQTGPNQERVKVITEIDKRHDSTDNRVIPSQRLNNREQMHVRTPSSHSIISSSPINVRSETLSPETSDPDVKTRAFTRKSNEQSDTNDIKKTPMSVECQTDNYSIVPRSNVTGDADVDSKLEPKEDIKFGSVHTGHERGSPKAIILNERDDGNSDEENGNLHTTHMSISVESQTDNISQVPKDKYNNEDLIESNTTNTTPEKPETTFDDTAVQTDQIELYSNRIQNPSPEIRPLSANSVSSKLERSSAGEKKAENYTQTNNFQEGDNKNKSLLQSMYNENDENSTDEAVSMVGVYENKVPETVDRTDVDQGDNKIKINASTVPEKQSESDIQTNGESLLQCGTPIVTAEDGVEIVKTSSDVDVKSPENEIRPDNVAKNIEKSKVEATVSKSHKDDNSLMFKENNKGGEVRLHVCKGGTTKEIVYRRNDSDVVDNLSFHKGFGAVLRTNVAALHVDTIQCDIEDALENEMLPDFVEGERVVSFQLRLQRKYGADLTIQEGEWVKLFLPHRPTSNCEDVSLICSQDNNDWEPCDVITERPESILGEVQVVGTRLRSIDDVKIVAIAREMMDHVIAGEDDVKYTSSIDSTVKINIERNVFKKRTEVKIQIHHKHRLELTTAVETHGECQQIMSCTPFVSIFTEDRTVRDMTVIMELQQEIEECRYVMFLLEDSGWKLADCSWETKQLTVHLRPGSKRYRLLGLELPADMTVEEKLLAVRTIHDHTSHYLVRLVVRQREDDPSLAVVVCLRSKLIKKAITELRSRGFSVGNYPSSQFCLKDRDELTLSVSGNIVASPVQSETPDLVFLSQKEMVIKLLSLHPVRADPNYLDEHEHTSEVFTASISVKSPRKSTGCVFTDTLVMPGKRLD